MKELAYDYSFASRGHSGISNDSRSIASDLEINGVKLNYLVPKRLIAESIIKPELGKIHNDRSKILFALMSKRAWQIRTKLDSAWTSHIWGLMLMGRKTNFVRIHDFFPITYPTLFKARSRHIFQSGFNTLRKGKFIGVTNSNSTLNEGRKLGLQNEMYVLYCSPSSLKQIPCRICEFCCDRIILEGTKFAVAIGTIEPRKNYINLIEQWAKQNIDLQLIIIGNPGWFLNYNQEIIKKSQDQRNVKLFSGVCDYQLNLIVNKSQFLINASLDEGFNMPALEARFMNSKVILSDRRTHREIHEDLDYFLNSNLSNLKSIVNKVLSSSINNFDNNKFQKNFNLKRQKQIKAIIERIT